MLTTSEEKCGSCSCTSKRASKEVVVKATEPRKRIQRRVVQQIPDEQLNDPLINEAIHVGRLLSPGNFSKLNFSRF